MYHPKKMALTDGHTFADDEAIFITGVLCFTARLPFEKRGMRKRPLLRRNERLQSCGLQFTWKDHNKTEICDFLF